MWFTDQETRIALGLASCAIILGAIYFTAWLCERFRKKEPEMPVDRGEFGVRFGCLEYDELGAYYPIYIGGKRSGKSRPVKNDMEEK